MCRDGKGEQVEGSRNHVIVRSFKGYLANQQNVDKIISPPYDVLNTKEARAMAEGNEMSFLHVNKPEIDLDPDVPPYDDRVYEQGRANLLEFIDKGYLVQDEKETMYIYRQEIDDHAQQGIVCLANIDDY